MWVIRSSSSILPIITGAGKWVEIKINADPLYQHLLLTAEKKFWRCVKTGEPPRLFGVEPVVDRLPIDRHPRHSTRLTAAPATAKQIRGPRP